MRVEDFEMLLKNTFYEVMPYCEISFSDTGLMGSKDVHVVNIKFYYKDDVYHIRFEYNIKLLTLSDMEKTVERLVIELHRELNNITIFKEQ